MQVAAPTPSTQTLRPWTYWHGCVGSTATNTPWLKSTYEVMDLKRATPYRGVHSFLFIHCSLNRTELQLYSMRSIRCMLTWYRYLFNWAILHVRIDIYFCCYISALFAIEFDCNGAHAPQPLSPEPLPPHHPHIEVFHFDTIEEADEFRMRAHKIRLKYHLERAQSDAPQTDACHMIVMISKGKASNRFLQMRSRR